MGSNKPNASNAPMRDVWSWALGWHRRPPTSRDKRDKQSILIGHYLAVLRAVDTPAALHAHHAADQRWAVNLARATFPREWTALGIHACTAAAYGLRYVEMQTCKTLDPARLPTWLGEWALF
jgi:hypothetical protein